MFCPRCGTKLHGASQYCVACGARLSDLGVPNEGRSEVTQASPPAAATGSHGGSVNLHAGFWRRVAASVVDSMVTFAALFGAGLLMGASSSNSDAAAGRFYFLSIVGSWLYSALMESSSWQATLGKMAIGIKVTDLNGDRIGFGRATGRYFAKFLSSLTLLIGFAMAGFTRRRQCLHDKIAGTLVVKKGATTAEIAAHPDAPHVPGWGVVLLVLAAVAVPGTGMLAAIGIPAYQDYTIRSQVSEGLMAAADYKAAVAEAAARGIDWQDIDSESLGLDSEAEAKYLKSIDVVGGVVVLIYGAQANSNIADAQLVLVPGVNDAGDVVWVCGYAEAPAGVTLAIEEYQHYTGIDKKYLPSACRATVQ